MEELLIAGLGIVGAFMFFVFGKVSAYWQNPTLSKIEAYAEYKPYALMAAKWVEETIEDELPADANKLTKSLHKLDMFLKKFNDIVQSQEGVSPSAGLMAAVKEWSIDLADEMNYRNEVKEATNAPTDSPA